MSAPGLSTEAQLRYIMQWFGEFSELQREDFLPVLAAVRGDMSDQLAATLANISCHDKPVSLFQCRIKLFNEWYPTWAEEEQDRLIKEISEVDADFGAKLQDYLVKGPQTNGELNGVAELKFIPDENDNNETHSLTEAENKTEESNTFEENIETASQVNSEETPVVSETIHLEIAAAS